MTGKTGDKDRCVFCDAADPAPDPSGQDSLVLVRGARSYVILNLYPYNNGHLMIAPSRHVGSLTEATDEELVELMRLTRDAEAASVRGASMYSTGCSCLSSGQLGRPLSASCHSSGLALGA